MYTKYENCYKDGKVPDEKSCRKCEDDLKHKEQECETLASQLDFEMQKKECLEQECKKLKLDLIEAKAHGDYLNNLILSETLDTVSAELVQLKLDYAELEKRHNDSFAQFEKIKKQNKNLKQYNDSKQASYESMQQQWNEVVLGNRRLKAENEELKKINKANAKSYEKHWYKLEKYKQTLTEIKEIAEDFGFNGTYESYKTAIDQILQKISEVMSNEKS